MFHRMPLISATAVFTTAFIFLLTVLFASSLSSPGTAQAQVNRASAFSQDALERNLKVGSPVSATDPEIDYGFSATNHDMPEVSIYAVMPEVAEEGRSITVTLKLSRPLTETMRNFAIADELNEDPRTRCASRAGSSFGIRIMITCTTLMVHFTTTGTFRPKNWSNLFSVGMRLKKD